MSSTPFADNSAAAAQAPNNKTSAIQTQVNEVVGIMQNNINRVMERGERLDTLQGKTEDLNNSAGAFRRGATQVRRKMWWENMKLKAIIALVAVAILLAIILPLVLGNSEPPKDQPQP